MKRILLPATIFLLLSSPIIAQSKKEMANEIEKLKLEIKELKTPKPINLDGDKSKASYCLGVLMGQNVKRQAGDSLSIDNMVAGFSDMFLSKPLLVSEQESAAFFQQYMQQQMERKAAKAKTEGDIFLNGNKNKPGVVSTPSGLQYKILKEGSGKMPGASDNVTVHYTGRLLDGTIFDSSVQRGTPASFSVNGVIRGWTEALQLMKEGDQWELYIPANLAYGERGAGAQIPPYATLIFEVELIKVN
jgi:FKBP-type peptidyl-prolyl cis-trans isomerase FklB